LGLFLNLAKMADVEVKCKDCGSVGENKVAKNGSVYIVCPSCPGEGAYKNKFLTFLKGAQKYMSEKPKGGTKRKAPASDTQSYAAGAKSAESKAKKQRIDEYDVIKNQLTNLDSKVDEILKRLETQLQKERKEESDLETEDEGSDS
jgi:hypothetical protein